MSKEHLSSMCLIKMPYIDYSLRLLSENKRPLWKMLLKKHLNMTETAVYYFILLLSKEHRTQQY